MKEPLAIKDESEMDKSIEKEKKEIISKQNISPDEFKNFFLKNSMEMFNEICKSKNPKNKALAVIVQLFLGWGCYLLLGARNK